MARRNLRNLDERILRKTISYGASDGISNISTKRIAKDLHITEPTIYVHFKTKENLLLSAYSKAVEDIYDIDSLKKADVEYFKNELDKVLLKLLLSAKANSEAIVYAFNYRHSCFFNNNMTEQRNLYTKVLTDVLAAYINDPEMNPATEKTLVSISFEIMDLFVYKAAKGEIEPNPVTAKILMALVVGGLSGSKEAFYARLTNEEKEALKNTK